MSKIAHIRTTETISLLQKANISLTIIMEDKEPTVYVSSHAVLMSEQNFTSLVQQILDFVKEKGIEFK